MEIQTCEDIAENQGKTLLNDKLRRFMETFIYTHTHKHRHPVINVCVYIYVNNVCVYIFLKMLYEIMCVYIDSLLFIKCSKKTHMRCSFFVPQ